MTQAKETINLMELRKNPAAMTKDTVQKALEPYKAALEAFKDACAKFEKDARQKDTGANGRRKEVSDRLAEIEREVNGLTSRLPEASLVGGEELEALEDQLDDLNAEASKLKRRISQLEKVENPGSEELYQEVLIAYSNLRETETATGITLTEISQIADEWLKYFKALSDEAVNAGQYGPGLHTHTGSKSYNAALVKIVEQHTGPIDVRGHHCGSDEAAKARYVAGLGSGKFNGLENTPAYRILKGIDQPAAPSRPMNEKLKPAGMKDEGPKKTVDVLSGWGARK
jgi:hypothetical protein